MPPRWAVLLIVFFWLAATSWQIQREMWPTWFPPPDEPPLFSVNMLDELNTNFTNWQVYVNGDEAGNGSSEVKDLGDGSLVFKTVLRFQKPLFDFCTYIGSSSRITNKGQLLGVSILVKVKLQDSPHINEIKLDAHVDKGHLKSTLTFPDMPGKPWDLPDVQVPENGIVFNPTHLGTRILDLRKGQTWRVPMMDAVSMLPKVPIFGDASKLAEGVVGKELWASVDEELIRWGNEDVVCYKIDFTQPDKGVIATTWVRRRNGEVLKQQAKMGVGLLHVDLLLIRTP